MEEHRKDRRSRALKGGLIFFNERSVIDCVIRNMSEAGACLEVESHLGIPDDFMLITKPEDRKCICQVAWRKAKRIGVRFVKAEG